MSLRQLLTYFNLKSCIAELIGLSYNLNTLVFTRWVTQSWYFEGQFEPREMFISRVYASRGEGVEETLPFYQSLKIHEYIVRLLIKKEAGIREPLCYVRNRSFFKG